MRKKKKGKLIHEFAVRRDEVVSRARLAANRQLPQHLLDSDFMTIFEWIITPHIKQEYEVGKRVVDKEVRGFQKLMSKIFRALGKNKKDIKNED